MKKNIIYALGSILFTSLLASCSQSYYTQNGVDQDDLYFNSVDESAILAQREENATALSEGPEAEKAATKTANPDYYEDYDGYSSNDYYDDDYYYSNRIRRFNQSFSSTGYWYTPSYGPYSYYDPFYRPSYSYYYTPYNPGTSISIGFGTYSTFGSGYYGYGSGYNTYYNSYYYNPWNSGYGYGYNNYYCPPSYNYYNNSYYSSGDNQSPNSINAPGPRRSTGVSRPATSNPAGYSDPKRVDNNGGGKNRVYENPRKNNTFSTPRTTKDQDDDVKPTPRNWDRWDNNNDKWDKNNGDKFSTPRSNDNLRNNGGSGNGGGGGGGSNNNRRLRR